MPGLPIAWKWSAVSVTSAIAVSALRGIARSQACLLYTSDAADD